MESLYDHDIARCALEPHGILENATASWSTVVLHRFERFKSASRRLAEAALWRAAKAEGLAHSKTCRRIGQLL